MQKCQSYGFKYMDHGYKNFRILYEDLNSVTSTYLAI
jgi:hypothetical protein